MSSSLSRGACARSSFAALALTLALVGCARHADDTTARALPLRLLADSAASAPLARSPVRAWLTGVSTVRPTPAVAVTPAPAALELAPPEARPDTLWPEPEVPAGLAVDPGLKPPILRTPAQLVRPRPPRARGTAVELDVRVDEQGDVSDALWAGGDQDSALVAAAVASALAMKFHPALRAGRPVAVWCRQRFDFGARRD